MSKKLRCQSITITLQVIRAICNYEEKMSLMLLHIEKPLVHCFIYAILDHTFNMQYLCFSCMSNPKLLTKQR